MQAYRAFIFDLNGTMINDMEFHIRIWQHILNHKLGAHLSWADVRREMYGKNQELLVRVFGDRFTEAERNEISVQKEQEYQAAYKPHLKLINGLDGFLKTAKEHHIPMAIASAAARMNVNFVIDGLQLRDYFQATISANDVMHSKPDPETFLKAAQALNIAAKDCLVFEDAPKGVEAARNAGMQAVVITTMHPKEEFEAYDNIVAFVADYTDPALNRLFATTPVS